MATDGTGPRRRRRVLRLREATAQACDRISELPDDLLIRVLESLPLCEVVRTSVLSRRWRHIWRLLPRLEFNASATNGQQDGGEQCVHASGGTSTSRRDHAFVHWVDGLLQRRTESPARIEALVLRFSLSPRYVQHLSRWVRTAMAMGASVLVLNLGSPPFRWRLPCRIPWCLVLSEGRSPSLLHLRLCFCLLEPPSRGAGTSLSLLRSLDLEQVPLTDSDLSGILSCCPLLEWLRLDRCEQLVSLQISHQSMSRLTWLIVERCYQLMNMEVSAMQLARLRYTGSMISSARLEAPLLLEASIASSMRFMDVNYVLTELPKLFPFLRKLTLSAACINPSAALGGLPRKTPQLENLKVLELEGATLEFTDDVTWVFTRLINAMPFLETFRLRIRPSFPVKQTAKVTEPQKCPHNFLKYVHIKGFRGCKSQTDLAACVLHNATVLRRMVIDMTRNVWELELATKLCEEAFRCLKTIPTSANVVLNMT